MNIKFLFLSLLLSLFAVSCGNTDTNDNEGIDSGEIINQAPDYEDIDSDGDGNIDYEEQSARGKSTTNTTNYADRADSLSAARDTLVDPKYTDDEYEPAFSTSTTNPKNQVEGGVTPGGKKKKDK